jgi:mRNA-degrading endonuclease toxin of MazEF toxin-antitoxin module
MNKGHTVVIIPLSTKFKKKRNGLPLYNNHYLLKKTDYPDLDKDSVAKFEDIRSIDVVRLREVICNVKPEDMKRMKNNLLFMCGY